MPPAVAQPGRRYPFHPPEQGPSLKNIQPETLSDDNVTNGINNGATALLALIKTDLADIKQLAGRRNRSSAEDYMTGEIALGVYSLLTAGRINGDPRLHFTSPEMTDAVQYLLAARPTFTYAAGLQAGACRFCPIAPSIASPSPPPAIRSFAEMSAESIPTTPSTSRSGATIPTPSTANSESGRARTPDSKFPLFTGPASAAMARNPVPLRNLGIRTQINRETSGRPMPNGSGSVTMTAAGVASLFLAKDDLDRSVLFQPRPDKNLDNGLKWLGDHFADYRDDLPTNLYLAYGLERVALAGGIKTLGAHDWYREGAALILNQQHANGTWQYERGSDAVGTAYAILFLTRGIAPVACAKLQYNGPWNARSRDCPRFVHWLDKQTERQLRWEILPIDSDPDDWRNVPILVITGHGDPAFTPDQIATLRKYVLAGGTIF